MWDAQCGPAPAPPAPPPPPPPPAPSTCDNACVKDGQSYTCRGRIQYLAQSGQKLADAISQVNGECNGQCSCSAADFGPAPSPSPTPPGPPSWCKHDSPQNACGPCGGKETACGNDDASKYFCLKDKEPACGAPGPSPGPAPPPGPPAGWCKHDSPQNACKPCDGTEAACGNSDPSKFFCLKDKEQACGAPAPSPSGGGGYCAHDSPTNACGR